MYVIPYNLICISPFIYICMLLIRYSTHMYQAWCLDRKYSTNKTTWRLPPLTLPSTRFLFLTLAPLEDISNQHGHYDWINGHGDEHLGAIPGWVFPCICTCFTLKRQAQQTTKTWVKFDTDHQDENYSFKRELDLREPVTRFWVSFQRLFHKIEKQKVEQSWERVLWAQLLCRDVSKSHTPPAGWDLLPLRLLRGSFVDNWASLGLKGHKERAPQSQRKASVTRMEEGNSAIGNKCISHQRHPVGVETRGKRAWNWCHLQIRLAQGGLLPG